MYYLIIASVLWGTSFPVIKHALDSISPFLFVQLRYTLAFFLLLPFIKNIRHLKFIFTKELFLMSLLNALAFVLQFKGQDLTSASKSALFINTNPLFVVVLAPLVTGEKPSRLQLVALALALTGVVMTSTRLQFGDLSAMQPGDLICLGSAAAWSFLIIYSGRVVRKFGEVNFNLAMYFWTALFSIPLIWLEPVRWNPAGIWPLIYISVFSTIIAYLCYSRGMKTSQALSGSIIFLIEVVVASVISFLFLGERFVAIEVVGFCLVITGVWLVVRPQRKLSPE